MLLDYGKVLLYLLHLEWRTVHLFKYICELSLLHSAFATAPPAKLACAVLLLSRALHHYGNATFRTPPLNHPTRVHPDLTCVEVGWLD